MGKIGWGGRIRTFTVLINSEVSYQLDHAPAGDCMAAPGRAGACRPSLQSDEEHKKHSMERAISKSGIGEGNHKKGLSEEEGGASEEWMGSGSVSGRITTMTLNFDLFRNVQNMRRFA